MNEFRQMIREAKENIPPGFYILRGEEICASDLVWSIYRKEFIRADSPEWLHPSPKSTEDIICAVRNAGIGEFEQQIERKRGYTMSNELPKKCRECGKDCLWLLHKETKKPAPIEVEPSGNGNVFISGNLYRIASADKIKKAKETDKPLYLNHFATCEFANSFRKEKPAAAAGKPKCAVCELELNYFEADKNLVLFNGL